MVFQMDSNTNLSVIYNHLKILFLICHWSLMSENEIWPLQGEQDRNWSHRSILHPHILYRFSIETFCLVVTVQELFEVGDLIRKWHLVLIIGFLGDLWALNMIWYNRGHRKVIYGSRDAAFNIMVLGVKIGRAVREGCRVDKLGKNFERVFHPLTERTAYSTGTITTSFDMVGVIASFIYYAKFGVGILDGFRREGSILTCM